MSGVTVGSHAIVGEVVARNFPERPVVGGVPGACNPQEEQIYQAIEAAKVWNMESV